MGRVDSSQGGGGAAEHPPGKGAPVDPELFTAAWSSVEPRLWRQLRRRLPDEEAADVCQEVALRAVRSRVQFRNATELFRWSSVVGHRIANRLLAEDEAVAVDSLDDDALDDAAFAATTDIEAEVAARTALQAALADASEADIRTIRAVFEAMEHPAGKRERDRLALQLHRARRRLRARLDDLLAAAGLKVARWRRAVPRPALIAGAGAVVAGAVIGGFHVGAALSNNDEGPAGRQVPASIISSDERGLVARVPADSATRPAAATVPPDQPRAEQIEPKAGLLSTGGAVATGANGVSAGSSVSTNAGSGETRYFLAVTVHCDRSEVRGRVCSALPSISAPLPGP